MSKRNLQQYTIERPSNIFSPIDNSQLLRLNLVRTRWRNAFEKLKMKQLFQSVKPGNDKKREYSSPAKLNIMSHSKNVLSMLTNNMIAQKFANILKKQFKSLSAKQYKLINDICYMDIDEDIKRRQKLKKAFEMNFLNAVDKQNREQLKRQFTESQKILTPVVRNPKNKCMKVILKPIRFLTKVYMPDGFFRVAFDIIAMTFIVFELLEIPVILSFQDINVDPSMDIFSDLITGFFLTDLLLNFNTAFYERGHVVTDRSEIGRHYLKSWFSVDLFSSFPYDLVIDAILPLFLNGQGSDSNAMNFSQSTKLLRTLQFIKFVRVLRLLRAFKLKRIFGKLEDYLQLTPTLNAVLALIRLSFMVICIAHWCACGFQLIATFEESIYPVTWVVQARLQDEDWGTRYITSIYWALTTMTTIGYGDVIPITNLEKIYTMFIMILSSGVFGYTMNRIGNILQSFNETSMEYKLKLFQINQYMKRKNVPKELQARVRKYIEYTLDPGKTNQIDEKILFQTLSKNLQDEITVFINGNIIKQYEFLYKIFSSDLLLKISFYIHENIYGPEEVIISENAIEEDPSIYFITSGFVTVFHQASRSFLNILKEGSYFGELAFFSNMKRTASVKSSDFISVYKLCRNDFWLVITQENLSDDREVFCQLKDKLELYKDHLLLNLVCYSCNCSGHVAKNCPEIHYIANADEVIKDRLASEKKQRQEFQRRPKKYVTMSQVSLVQTSAYAIRNTMFLFYEEGIKENYRVETDLNDFLEENPKGVETLSKKIINYQESNSYRLLNPSDYEERRSLKALDESQDEEFLKSLKTLKKAEKNEEYDEIWHEFERIEIFNKYFIHNNFTIVKKKLKTQKASPKNEKKRQSLQKKIQLLKKKTIRINKKPDASENVSPLGFKEKECETPSENVREANISAGILNISKKIPKRSYSVESMKECEKFIEKFGVENVYNMAKHKIEDKL